MIRHQLTSCSLRCICTPLHLHHLLKSENLNPRTSCMCFALPWSTSHARSLYTPCFPWSSHCVSQRRSQYRQDYRLLACICPLHTVYRCLHRAQNNLCCINSLCLRHCHPLNESLLMDSPLYTTTFYQFRYCIFQRRKECSLHYRRWFCTYQVGKPHTQTSHVDRCSLCCIHNPLPHHCPPRFVGSWSLEQDCMSCSGSAP